MDKREILQRIIDNGGDCEALHSRTQIYLCKTCPMSKLKKRPDGTYLSCWESILSNGDGTFGDLYDDMVTQKYAEDLYLEKAIELLQDIAIEDMLRGDPVAENP